MKVLQKKWALQSSVFVLLTISAIANAQSFQNLVPNGSFETFTQCPNTSSQIYLAPPWTGPTINSSDYLNSCSSSKNVPKYGGISNQYPYYLLAKDGNAYAGIYSYQLNNYREYIQLEVADTLSSGGCYYVEFYATNCQRLKYKTNNIALCFSGIGFPVNLVYPGAIPNITQHITNYDNPVLKDTVKWEKISGIYQGNGIEKFVIIGNFKDDSNTDTVNVYPVGSAPYSGLAVGAYVFIDAVSVYSINPNGLLPWSYKDTIINKGDSVFIGNKMGGLNFHPKWYKADGTFIKTHAGITVSPTVTSKYYVQYTLCGVQRTDTVKVTVPTDDETAIEKFNTLKAELKIFPNPASDEIRIHCDLLTDNENIAAEILDDVGRSMFSSEIEFSNREANVNTASLSAGVYCLKLKTSKGTVWQRFVVSRE